MSFETLGLGPNLIRSIGEVGYSDPTPIQEAAIPLIIDGNDLIGLAVSCAVDCTYRAHAASFEQFELLKASDFHSGLSDLNARLWFAIGSMRIPNHAKVPGPFGARHLDTPLCL